MFVCKPRNFYYRKLDSSGISSFSSCQMYNFSFPTDDHQWDYENWNFSDHNVVGKYLLRLKISLKYCPLFDTVEIRSITCFIHGIMHEGLCTFCQWKYSSTLSLNSRYRVFASNTFEEIVFDSLTTFRSSRTNIYLK